MERLFVVASTMTLLGFVLVMLSSLSRKDRGLGSGRTIALDNATLHSEVHGLVGRPDRIVRDGGHLIPEEWKSAKRVSHRLQLATNFILIEEEYGERPPFGIVVLGDGSRHEVENTDKLRAEVLTIAKQIRERRRVIGYEIRVRQPAWKCCVCGQKNACSRA